MSSPAIPRSPPRVNKFTFPDPFGYAVILLAAIAYYTFLSSNPIFPFSIFAAIFPTVVQQAILWGIPVIHALEAFFVMRPLLKKYKTNADNSGNWYLSCMLEGYPSIQRLNNLAEKSRKAAK
eukprot:TRINITY_DN1972_c0_g1_i1.p1 TRINITY_DN1972_c0_g1~~TRINITY_DN1972_c0_g1_i1.p1  ORF type:complete len:122 (-),score=34.26 TRINITY_DN1972_c0_g1_i1:316-681(-)